MSQPYTCKENALIPASMFVLRIINQELLSLVEFCLVGFTVLSNFHTFR